MTPPALRMRADAQSSANRRAASPSAGRPSRRGACANKGKIAPASTPSRRRACQGVTSERRRVSRASVAASAAVSPTISETARTIGNLGMFVRVGAIAGDTTRTSSMASPLVSLSSFWRFSNCS